MNQSHFDFSSWTTRFTWIFRTSEREYTVCFKNRDFWLLSCFELLERLQGSSFKNLADLLEGLGCESTHDPFEECVIDVPGEQIQSFAGLLECLMHTQMNNPFQSGGCETAVIQAGVFEDGTAFLAGRADQALRWKFDRTEQTGHVNVGCAVFLDWFLTTWALGGKSSLLGCWRGFRGWW